MPHRRVIAHIDADAFYASVHLLEDPSLRGKPVVVAGTSARSIVTTASYEARKFGIRSAQPASQARRLCPQAVFLRPDFDLYRAYSQRAREVIERYCEVVEPLSLDEAYLDITAFEQPVRRMREMVAEIRSVTGLTYSVGIGPNKLCAKVLSDHNKPNAFNVASREQCCELFAECSPRLLPGIGPKSVDALERLGLHTITALREAPAGKLEVAFGARRGGELRSRAHFEHDGEVQVERELKSKSEETTFEHDIDDLGELQERLHALAIDLCERLETRELRGRTIGIKVRLADFTTVTRARTLADYTSDGRVVAEVACELLREYAPAQPVRLIGVRMASFEQEDDAERAPAVWEQLRLQLRLSQYEHAG